MRFVAIASLLLIAMGITVAGADNIPPALASTALDQYPQSLRCQIAYATSRGLPLDVDPAVPITEDIQRGWLQAKIGTLSASGQQVAVVVYKRYGFNSVFDHHEFVRIFVLDGTQWVSPPLEGKTPWVIESDAVYVVDPSRNPDARPRPPGVVFSDVDGDGVKEILLYGFTPGNFRKWESIIVLALRNGALVALTGLDVAMEPGSPRGPAECRAAEATFAPRDQFVSENGAGFIDMDSDGINELLIYPKLGGDRPEGDMQHGRYYDVPTTGTRVYKLVNGVYTFQYETPVGTSGMPPIGAAMKPAWVTVDELQSAAGGGGGGKDEAISLYLMPPEKLALDAVGWASLRIGDFKIAATADRGVSLAPHSATEQTPWLPMGFGGQPMLLEELAGNDQGQFQQSDNDPVVYIGLKGRLHMTTAYRQQQFSKKALFAWAWQQWQAGAGDQTLKGCMPQGNHQRCFTPLHIPVKVNLTSSHGFAMGEAMLWVETKEPAVPSAAPPGTAVPTAAPSPK